MVLKSTSELEIERTAGVFGLDLENETAVDNKFTELCEEIIRADLSKIHLDNEEKECIQKQTEFITNGVVVENPITYTADHTTNEARLKEIPEERSALLARWEEAIIE